MAANTISEETHYERRRRAVHERILAAALERFEQSGIAETRVDDICAVAKVAQKTFFNHFPSKQDLLREIAALFLQEVVAAVADVRRMKGTAGERLARLFNRLAIEAEAAPPMRRTLVVELIRSLHGDPSQTQLSEVFRSTFAGLLRDGMRAGDVTDTHPLPILAQVVAGSFYVLLLDWVSIDAFPVRKRAREMAAFLADALAQRAARGARPTDRRGRASGAARPGSPSTAKR